MPDPHIIANKATSWSRLDHVIIVLAHRRQTQQQKRVPRSGPVAPPGRATRQRRCPTLTADAGERHVREFPVVARLRAEPAVHHCQPAHAGGAADREAAELPCGCVGHATCACRMGTACSECMMDALSAAMSLKRLASSFQATTTSKQLGGP